MERQRTKAARSLLVLRIQDGLRPWRILAKGLTHRALKRTDGARANWRGGARAPEPSLALMSLNQGPMVYPNAGGIPVFR